MNKILQVQRCILYSSYSDRVGYGSSSIPGRSVARVPRRTLASFTREESARTIHNIVGRNVASLVPQRTTPRDGNGRDNYLDSGEYMLPSAAWDLPAVVSMVFHGVPEW